MREKNARNNQTRKKQENTQRKNPENNKPKPNANPTNEHSIKNERLELPRIRKTTPKTTQKRPLKGLLKGPNLPYNPTNFPHRTTRTNDQPGKKTKKSRRMKIKNEIDIDSAATRAAASDASSIASVFATSSYSGFR